jgi:hypothetical protein
MLWTFGVTSGRAVQLTVIGSVGMGLVWGWLLVLVGWRAPRPFITIPALGLATLLTTLSLFLFTTWPTPLYFLAAALLTLIIHVSWRQELRKNL